MTMTCSACDHRIGRADCHRNRYGEYICHGCHKLGVRYTWRKRLGYLWRKLTIGFWIALGLTALALLTAWALHMMMLLPSVWIFK